MTSDQASFPPIIASIHSDHNLLYSLFTVLRWSIGEHPCFCLLSTLSIISVFLLAFWTVFMHTLAFFVIREIAVVGHEQIGVMMIDFDCFFLPFSDRRERIIITLIIFISKFHGSGRVVFFSLSVFNSFRFIIGLVFLMMASKECYLSVSALLLIYFVIGFFFHCLC